MGVLIVIFQPANHKSLWIQMFFFVRTYDGAAFLILILEIAET